MSIDFNKTQPERPQWVSPPSPASVFMPLPETYYRHSGKFSPGGLAAVLFAGSSIEAVLAVVYDFSIIYIPYAKLRFCFTFLFAIGLAWIFSKLIPLGKIRSRLLITLTSLTLSAIVFYVTWAFWMFALFQRFDSGALDLFTAFTSPVALVQMALKLNETGVWSYGGTKEPMTGWVLWLIWALEAAAIFGGPLLMVFRNRSPFCETCNEWTTETKGALEVFADSDEQIRDILKRKNYDALFQLPRRRPGQGFWYGVNTYSCEKCNQLHTVGVDAITLRATNNGETEQAKAVLKDLLIHQAELARIRSGA